MGDVAQLGDGAGDPGELGARDALAKRANLIKGPQMGEAAMVAGGLLGLAWCAAVVVGIWRVVGFASRIARAAEGAERKAGSAVKAEAGTWACPKCTAKNEGGDFKCGACNYSLI